MVMQADKQEIAVYRGSDETISIDNDDLVVGDIIKFAAGMKVPADCVMIDG